MGHPDDAMNAKPPAETSRSETRPTLAHEWKRRVRVQTREAEMIVGRLADELAEKRSEDL
jgi:hypothetical protein